MPDKSGYWQLAIDGPIKSPVVRPDIRFRPHRELFEESMREVKLIRTRADLEAIAGPVDGLLTYTQPADNRADPPWDTYMVVNQAGHAVGFVDAPVPDVPLRDSGW